MTIESSGFSVGFREKLQKCLHSTTHTSILTAAAAGMDYFNTE